MGIRENRAKGKAMRHAFAECRKMWKRKMQPFAKIKGILEAEQTQRTDTAENTGRFVEDRIEVKVNKIKWK